MNFRVAFFNPEECDGDVQKLIDCITVGVRVARVRHGVKLPDNSTTANSIVSKVKTAFANAFTVPNFAPALA